VRNSARGSEGASNGSPVGSKWLRSVRDERRDDAVGPGAAGGPDLRADLLASDQVYPETSLLGRFETGDLDAAVVYRSMAADRGFPYRELPAAVDLSDPARDDAYGDAAYTLASGETVTGESIAYGLRARSTEDATRRVFDAVASGELLADHGFVVPDAFPTFEGEVPRAVRT